MSGTKSPKAKTLEKGSRLYRARLLIGTAVWAVWLLDSFVYNLGVPLIRTGIQAFAVIGTYKAIPVLALLALLMVLRRRKAWKDLAIGFLAPLLIAAWHLPKWLYQHGHWLWVMAYASIFVTFIERFRRNVLVALAFVVGVVLLALSLSPTTGMIGGLLLCIATLLAALERFDALLSPAKLLGADAESIRVAMKSDAVKKFLQNVPQSEKASPESRRVHGSVSAGETGEENSSGIVSRLFLTRLMLFVAHGIREYVRTKQHLPVVAVNGVSAALLALTGIASLNFGLYNFDQHLFSVSNGDSFLSFLAYALLASFRIPGSGIEPNHPITGIILWMQVLPLAILGIGSTIGFIRALTKRYERAANEVAEELQTSASDLDEEFEATYGLTPRSAIALLQNSDNELAKWVVRISIQIGEIQTVEVKEERKMTTVQGPNAQ